MYLQVQYSDGVPGDLSTAHPSIMGDSSLLNFTRSLPNGGFHLFKQDPQTLRRTEVRGWWAGWPAGPAVCPSHLNTDSRCMRQVVCWTLQV